MKPKDEEPTISNRGDALAETTERHPAYGQISASRCTSSHGINLYGSDFGHRDFIRITIARSSLSRGLSHDWHHTDDELIEVYVSEAQWASFVSTLNYGTGPCCTIQHVGMKSVPGIARRVDRREQFRAENAKHLDAAERHINELLALVEAGKLTKTVVRDHLIQAKNNLKSGVNFVADSFDKHMEKTVEHAKGEIEAHASNVMQRLGSQALADKLSEGGSIELLLEDPGTRKVGA